MNDLSLEKFSDHRWRLNNLYKIVDKQGQLVTFRENSLQKLVNEDPSKHKIILKARQIGFSTSRILRLLDDCIWNTNRTCVIIAHEDDSIIKLFRIVYRALKFMPDEIKPTIEKGGGSKYEYFFPKINSRIYCDLESRSDTIHKLHVSEIGLMKNDDRVRATIDAVPIDGEITYESTPKGINHFFEMWNDPNRTDKKFFFPWYMFPEYKLDVSGPFELTSEEIELQSKALKYYGVHLTHEQIAFRRWKISQKGKGDRGLRAFLEEFPEDDQSCFLTSGNPAMDSLIVSALMKECPEPLSNDGHLKIFKPYEKIKRYVCAADTAEGKRNGDACSADIFEVGSMEQVATLHGRWKPYDFAHEINKLCSMYTSGGKPYPLLGVERNNHGHAVLLELREHIKYQNLYFHKDDSLGFLSDRVTRPITVDTFIDGVENKTIILNDKETLAECLTLVENNGKIEAAEGKHDDRVMSAAIAIQLCINSQALSVYDNIGSKIFV